MMMSRRLLVTASVVVLAASLAWAAEPTVEDRRELVQQQEQQAPSRKRPSRPLAAWPPMARVLAYHQLDTKSEKKLFSIRPRPRCRASAASR
jgi:hypothetical protein